MSQKILNASIVGLMIIALSGCNSDEIKTIDPSLLPPAKEPVVVVASPSIDTSEVVPSTGPSSLPDEVIVGSDLPVNVGEGLGTYQSSTSEKIVIEGDATTTNIPKEMTNDITARLQKLPPIEDAQKTEQRTIRVAWMESIEADIFSATGKHSIFVVEMPGFAVEENAKGVTYSWGFWVKKSETESISFDSYNSKEEAVIAAAQWNKDNADKYIISTS